MIRFTSEVDDTALIDVARFNAENDIEGEDETRDELAAKHIAGASLAIAASCGRIHFAQATAEETFDIGGPIGKLWLSHWPVLSIASVTEDGAALTPGDYELDGGRKLWRMRDGRRSHWSGCRIVVTYLGGYVLPEDCPDDLAGVCLEMVGASWSARGRDPKIKAEEIPGVQKFEYWVGALDGVVSEASAGVLGNYRNFAF